MARTKPQVMPAVSGTIAVTVELAEADAGELLDSLTRSALLRSLSAIDPDLDWRYDYTHDEQIGENAEYWKGRRPAEHVDPEDFLALLVQDDQVGPAMGREVEAQFAKDPEWDATQGANKLESGHQLVTWMTEWHAEADLTGAAKDAARAHWWAGVMLGRVYVPDEYQEQLAQVRTIDEALALIHVQAVDPREGGPIKDRHGRVLGYWYRYDRTLEDGETEQIVEVHTPDRILRFVQDRLGKLVLDEDGEKDNPFQGGNQGRRIRRAEYLMWHADRDGGSSLTKSIRHAQDRLTAVATYHGRNDDQTGYRQFVTANAEQPRDKKGNPVPFQMGPGVVVNLKGLRKSKELTDVNDVDRHMPTWQVVEPLDPRSYHIPSAGKWKSSILEKLDQLWTMNPETQVSGESKRQSRKPFDRRVAFGAQNTGGFMAWALRAALVLACQIVGTTEYQDVTFQPKLYLDVDAVNLEELRVKLQMWESGALTLVSLLEATPGVSDAAKEAKALEEGEGSPDAKKGKEALERLTNPGPREDGGGGEA